MKKKLIVLFALLSLSTSVFAKGIYRGNVQISGGYNNNKLFIYQQDSLSQTDALKLNALDFGIQTWHTFKLPILLEVGFMFDFDLGFGQVELPHIKNNISMNTYALLGPAVAINVLNIVKFNLALGLGNEFALAFVDDFTKLNYGFGFGCNLQTLFLPSSPVSPIIGYKFAYMLGETAYGVDQDNHLLTTPSTSLKNEFYIGISFNW